MSDHDNTERQTAGPAGQHNRRWALGLMGLGAVALGGMLSWRRFALGPAEPEGVWQHSFADPNEDIITLADFRGSPLLLNFWATWCPPCVEEMPMLSAFYTQAREQGWEMLGLAIDQPELVRRFLEKTPVSYPIGIAGFAGVDLTRELGNTQGGLPFTVVFDRDGAISHRKLGQLKESDLAGWLAQVRGA